jgi:hypothetical protein
MTTKDLYRHKRTGGIYEVICTATHLPSKLHDLVVYRSIETGEIWARSRDKFFDGRFEKIESGEVDVPAAQPAPEHGHVYQIAKKDGPASQAWIDVDAETFEDAGFYPEDFNRRKLYTTPPAQPAPVQPGIWAMAFIEKMRETIPAQPAPVARVIDDGTPEGATEWIPFVSRVEPLKTGDLLYTTPPAAQPAPVQDSTCNETLCAQGKPYPLTCGKCGLGPCIGAPKQPPAAQPAPVQTKTVHITWTADGVRTVNGVPDYTTPRASHVPEADFGNIERSAHAALEAAVDAALNTPPAQAAPVTEPLGFMNAGLVHEMQQGSLPYGYVYPKGGSGASVAIYTTPPAAQRQWVGLTDAERDAIFELHHTSLGGWDYSGDEVMYDKHFEDAVAAIEAKLKEKNNG